MRTPFLLAMLTISSALALTSFALPGASACMPTDGLGCGTGCAATAAGVCVPEPCGIRTYCPMSTPSTICPESGGCPLPPIVCQPITDCVLLSCDVLPSESVAPWIAFTGTSCFGGDLTVCTKPAYQNPVSPKVGRVVCDGWITVALP